MEHKMRRISLTGLVLLLLVGIVTVFYFQGELRAYSHTGTNQISANRANTITGSPSNTTAYIYYTLKQSTGFVLARALRGSSGQPVSDPEAVAHFSDGFGLAESDSVLNMQLSPDGHYLAIDGTRDHGEQVWIYDTQQNKLTLTPANVLGNFLRWLPGQNSHTFLYRPMFPMGPQAPMDWNPGLWEVDSATG